MTFHVRRATRALALIACVLGCNLFERRAVDLFPDRVEADVQCPDGPGCTSVPACIGVAYAGCEVPVATPCGELEPCVASCGADCDGPREPDAVAPELEPDADPTEEPDTGLTEEPDAGPIEEPHPVPPEPAPAPPELDRDAGVGPVAPLPPDAGAGPGPGRPPRPPRP